MIKLVYDARALTCSQIKTALFSLTRLTRCQYRLTRLVENHWLDRLPRSSVNDPAVYVLSRHSLNGNRLMRDRYGDKAFRQHTSRLGSIGHLLGVNEIRVRAYRACRDLGWALHWLQPEAMRHALPTGLIPDAYIRVQHQVGGETRTASFFLELERAGKSRRVLEGKLRRYADFYYSQAYATAFGTKALRLLIVYATHQVAPRPRIDHGVEAARRLGVTIARFAALDSLKSAYPTDLLCAALWWQPGRKPPTSLFAEPIEEWRAVPP